MSFYRKFDLAPTQLLYGSWCGRDKFLSFRVSVIAKARTWSIRDRKAVDVFAPRVLMIRAVFYLLVRVALFEGLILSSVR